MTQEISWHQSDLLDYHGKNIFHGFFTRSGGCSEGIYNSFNCGPGSHDDPISVQKNIKNLAKALKIDQKNLFFLYQIHSNICADADQPWVFDQRPKADGMVSKSANFALVILTADCAPLLFYDPVEKIIGAAHAGWRGAVSGIIENTLEMMVHKGADLGRISVAIGPCIGWENYEVGLDFIEETSGYDTEIHKFFRPNPKNNRSEKPHFDLSGYIKDRLKRRQIKSVMCMDHDTYQDEAQYFSCRRSTHAGVSDYGRQVSVIMLK